MTSDILKKYGDRVSLAHFDFPLRPLTFQAAEAARCAGRQGKFWEYHGLLFQTSRDWTQAPAPWRAFDRMAADLGLDPQKFASCMDARAERGEVERDRALGESLRVDSTPTFFINDRRFVGYLPLAEYERAVRAALQESGRAR